MPYINMNSKKVLYFLFLCIAMLLSCEEKHEEASNLLDEIKAHYDKGNYEVALACIDSLRRTYPDAISQRKEALAIYQQASLVLAQQNLAIVDSTLQVLEREYDMLKPKVEKRHNQGIATAEELHHLNLLRARRDSFRGVFNVECAKIKYIHKRQKETEAIDSQMPQQN